MICETVKEILFYHFLTLNPQTYRHHPLFNHHLQTHSETLSNFHRLMVTVEAQDIKVYLQ